MTPTPKHSGITGDLSGISGDRRYSPAPKARKQLGEVLCRRLAGCPRVLVEVFLVSSARSFLERGVMNNSAVRIVPRHWSLCKNLICGAVAAVSSPPKLLKIRHGDGDIAATGEVFTQTPLGLFLANRPKIGREVIGHARSRYKQVPAAAARRQRFRLRLTRTGLIQASLNMELGSLRTTGLGFGKGYRLHVKLVLHRRFCGFVVADSSFTVSRDGSHRTSTLLTPLVMRSSGLTRLHSRRFSGSRIDRNPPDRRRESAVLPGEVA